MATVKNRPIYRIELELAALASSLVVRKDIKAITATPLTVAANPIAVMVVIVVMVLTVTVEINELTLRYLLSTNYDFCQP
jgi:hypothetical protein